MEIATLIFMADWKYQVIFMVIFTVECFSAIIAKGLWQHDEAYLKVSVFLIQEATVFMICHQSEHLEFS